VPLWWNREKQQFTLEPPGPENGVLSRTLSDVISQWYKYSGMLKDGSVQVIRITDGSYHDGGFCIVRWGWYQRATAETSEGKHE